MIQSGWSPQRRKNIGIACTVIHWPKMKEDIQAYVKTWHVCQVDEIKRKRKWACYNPYLS